MATDPRIGQVIDDRYEILELIGTGGMGAVYRAERVGLGRVVAVKFLHNQAAARDDARKRFDVEAQAMARLDHPSCAKVIDFGVHNASPYVVMDYVAGESLRDVMDRGPMPPPQAIAITRQILSGVAHAHEQGIVHRDLKPGNVMVGTVTGVGTQVTILDFGLARLADADSRLTGAGRIIGTPAYLAPECTQGTVDHRADLYACGVLLFEMLTGQQPFQAEDPVEVVAQHCQTPPPTLAQAMAWGQPPGSGPMAPTAALGFGDLEAVVARALVKDPALRFQSAGAFAAALAAARGPWWAAPSRELRLPAITPGRAVALGLGALLLLGIVIAATSGDGSPAPPDAGAPIERPDAAGEADLEASIPDAPEVEQAKALIAAGAPDRAIDALQALEKADPDNAEASYLIGRLYFEKLWWRDGIEAYQRAIERDPRFRDYPPLIKSALEGFIVAPEYHRGLAAFLRRDLGEAAIPYLEETASDHPREHIRARAERVLRKLR